MSAIAVATTVNGDDVEYLCQAEETLLQLMIPAACASGPVASCTALGEDMVPFGADDPVFEGGGRDLRLALAAWSPRRVKINDRATSVQLVEDRRERRVTRIAVAVAREQTDPVGAQNVQRIPDLVQGVLDTR